MSWRVAGLLFVATLASRLPFATTHLWAHDSVLYERAVTLFDPAGQSPQPPGYLWYVLLIRAVAAALSTDANTAMVLIAAVASALAVVLLYALATRVTNERGGIAAAALLFTSVTFWGEGAVAYPYTLLAALTTGCALAFWQASEQRDGRALVLASLIWGLAVGFRTDLGLFLAPLWLFTAYRVGRPRPIVLGAAIVAIAVGAWLAASAFASPSPQAFFAALSEQSRYLNEQYSIASGGLAALKQNGYELARFLGRGLLAIAPLLGLLAVPAVTRRALVRDHSAVFLALWTLAPLPIYLFIHIGEYGYAFSMLPGLCILAVRAAESASTALRRPAVLGGLIGFAALTNALLFLFAPIPLSARDLTMRDHAIDERLAALRELEPACTLVITAYDALVVNRYVRGYTVLAYGPAETPTLSRPLGSALPRCRLGSAVVVLWDDLLRTGGGDWSVATMPHGALLRSAAAPVNAVLRIHDALTVDLTAP